MPDESKLPSLMSGDERSATSSLETINRECITYLATYGSGFPAKLNNLGPSAPATPKFANLIDYELASGNKDDYTFIYRAGAAIDGITPTYAIQANPSTPGRNGKRYFFTDQTTLIRFNTSHPATKADPPLN